MTNKEIGKIFTQIADILELGNEQDRFRVIAYQRAAQAIENHSEEMKTVYQKGGLKALEEVPGVGKSLAEKIEEILKTGKLKYLKDIQKKVPSSEIEFLKIPGIGPKTAVKIAEKLKAKNIKDLEKKLKTGKGDILFEPKTQANILRGINILKRSTGRMLISEALPIAEDFLGQIKKIKGVKRVDYVGSLRRMKETIGDIDIVAASSRPLELIENFVKFSGVSQIISKGEAKSTVIHQSGAQIDLEIVPENEYGSLLQHFTGSKEHNVALRTFAQSKGRSLSEHGIKVGKKQYKFSQEKGYYEFLKMAWIPPELREDRGEIEAALRHQLPDLIIINDIKGDLHVHSNWSDGFMTIEEIAQKAEILGYEYIVVSDHTVGLGIAGGLDEKELAQREKEIQKVQKKHPRLKILSSVEVNIKANGDLDIKDWMLKKLDIVTASIHTSFFQDKKTMTKRLIGAIDHKDVDIIGHPSGRIIGQREPYQVDWDSVFRAAAKNQTALEISAFPNRLDLSDILCKLAKSYGVKFAISTDSHQLKHLDLMNFGVGVARRGWLEKKDIINTRNLNDLLSWSKR